MKIREFASFDEFMDSESAGNWEEISVIRENGWIKADLVTECRRWETAVRRLFRGLEGVDSIFKGWEGFVEESARQGYFEDGDFACIVGGKEVRNPFPSWKYQIENIGEKSWYVYIGLDEETHREAA